MRGLWLFFALIVFLLSAGGAGCVAVFRQHGWWGLLLAFAGLFACWFVTELVAGVFFYTHAQFIPEQGDGSA
jgi:hypothetical protein